ncbi:MAG: protein translocase subunit SecD [Acidimicrobiia bacterium]
MNAIPTWVFTSITVILIGSTLVVAYKNRGGIKNPVQLFAFTLLTVAYIFSLTFIQNVRPLLGLDLKGGVSIVLSAKGNPSSDKLSLARDIIDNRVNGLGVAEPDIRVENKNIIVDMPGVKDARKAQELVGQTAELRFREVTENQSDPTVQQVLIAVQQSLLPKKVTPKVTTKSSTTTTKVTTTTTAKSTGPGKSYRLASSTTTTSTPTTTTTATLPQASTAPTSVTLKCGGTAAVDVVMTGDLTKPTPREKDDPSKPIIALDENKTPYLLCPTILKGNIVKTATRDVDTTTGEVGVGVTLTSKGGSQFTQKIGRPLTNQLVAIVLDSKVISAPQIQSDLANGLTNNRLRITVGQKNQVEEVDKLVTVLKYGSLPVVLEQQSAQKVSPTLGTDQLKAGIVAGLIGLLFVVIYMILYYRILAFVVVSGIGLTSLSIYALISWLGTSQGLTLSLAGAVGLIVSLGVTVDSYVVYFEKLKDEVKQGRSIRSSLDPAFKSSFRTILAADLVSLIGATVLFILAAGSVRGFAFFLGLSTLLDLIISICFMHPFVKILAKNNSLIDLPRFGLASALDSSGANKEAK